MTTRTRIVILLVGLALAIGGCASGTSGSATSTPVLTPSNTSGCPATVTITPADAEKTVCVAVGGVVTVDLSSANGARWQPIEVGGDVLTPKGTPSADPGGQRATFDATAAGTATIQSAHRACPSSPGTLSCHAIIAFTVTVDVKA
jgi:hypothetical protein